MSSEYFYQWSLRALGEQPPDELARLMLFSQGAHTRTAAIAQFRQLPRELALGVIAPVLLRALQSEVKSSGFEDTVREAVRVLGDLPDSSAVPALMEMLGAYFISTRAKWEVVRALGKIGHDAAPAIPQLADLMYSDALVIPALAAKALYQIHTKEAIKALGDLVAAGRCKTRFNLRISHSALAVAKAAFRQGRGMPDVDALTTKF